MKIAIICAMDQELDFFIEKFNPTKETISNIELYKIQHKNLKLYFCTTKIGKVAAASRVTKIINLFNIDLVINSGVAGSLDQTVTLDYVVVANSLAYHDVDLNPFGYKKGALPKTPQFFSPSSKYCAFLNEKQHQNINVKQGLVVSGDQFISDEKRLKEIKTDFPNAVAIEMESCAIAHASFLENVDFVIIRAISDAADESAAQDFNKNLTKSAINSALITCLLLERIAS